MGQLLHEQISDPAFRRAVDLLDGGDAEGLRAYLSERPGIARQRVPFEGRNYFSNPSLLEFAAGNPIRHETLPPDIVDVVKVVLNAGAKDDQAMLDATLQLVCSGKVPRECNVQLPLIDLLCDYGASPEKAMVAACAHGEFAAVKELIKVGASVSLPVAAATGRFEQAVQLLADANPGDRHRALALAAQFGHGDIVRLLLDAGEDPNRYNPPGVHAHSTPLHQAALAGHIGVVRLLVEHGARLDLEDTIYQGTPPDWANHAGQTSVEMYLKTRGNADAGR